MININATIFIQIINLLVLIFILNRIMFQPIRKIAAEREKKLAEGRAAAEEMSQENYKTRAVYQSDLNKGRQKVRTHFSRLKDETTRQAQQILEETSAKAKAKGAEMTAQIEREIEEARQDIRKQAEGVAVRMAQSLLGRNIS